jgi:F-type H+-transporting ATPase subunit b
MQSVTLVASRFAEALVAAETGGGPADLGPNPIAPELKELLWGGGSFLVLLLIMKFLFPVLRKGMQARYDKIHNDHEQATAMTASAQSEVVEYRVALAGLRSEAAARLDVARATLEAERASRIAEVNVRIEVERRVAMEQAEAARAAVTDQVRAAVSEVTAQGTSLVLGAPASPETVERAVTAALTPRVVNA